MHISFDLNWLYGDREKQQIDHGLLRLLEAIKSQGSLRLASEVSHLSYRHAWGLIKKWEMIFGSPLVTLKRGRNHGANLTSLGEKLVHAQRMVSDKFQSEYESIAEQISLSLQKEIKLTGRQHLKISASHGMAINFLHRCLQENREVKTIFEVHGSLESLRLLNQSGYDVAGFHYPLGDLSKSVASVYRQYLNPERHELLLLATRQQGIITDANNSAKIKSLSDLGKRTVRFINRQAGSGTRTILDQLLASKNINRKVINGYSDEEFTHVAVAAMIASGAANTGFGIKAAASQFDLNFIPIIKEAYVLAINKKIPGKLKTLLKDLLVSKRLIQTVNTYPGYDAKNAGEKLEIEKLLCNCDISL